MQEQQLPMQAAAAHQKAQHQQHMPQLPWLARLVRQQQQLQLWAHHNQHSVMINSSSSSSSILNKRPTAVPHPVLSSVLRLLLRLLPDRALCFMP
jgi:hypothetical protein